MTATSNPIIGRQAAQIAQHQHRLSDRLHASEDAAARQHGWDITVTTGRLGFGGRAYRDHRFATRAPGHRAGTLVGQQRQSSAR